MSFVTQKKNLKGRIAGSLAKCVKELKPSTSMRNMPISAVGRVILQAVLL